MPGRYAFQAVQGRTPDPVDVGEQVHLLQTAVPSPLLACGRRTDDVDRSRRGVVAAGSKRKLPGLRPPCPGDGRAAAYVDVLPAGLGSPPPADTGLRSLTGAGSH
jgi:hypothetical protein